MNIRASIAALLLSSLAILPSARAELVSYSFTAKINGITTHYPDSSSRNSVDNVTLRNEHISLGQLVQGSFTYDTTTKLSYIVAPDGISDYRIYRQEGAGNTANFSFNNTNFKFSDTSTPTIYMIKVLQPQLQQPFYTDHVSFETYSYLSDEMSRFRLYFIGDNVLQSATLSNVPFSSFSTSGFVYEYVGFGEKRFSSDIRGTMISLTRLPIAPVPEPSTYAMLLAGLAGIGLIIRRRQAGN